MDDKRSYLRKYTVAELRDHVRAEAIGLRGYSKMKRVELENIILEQHDDTGGFKKLFQKKKVRAAIVATTEQLRDATKKVREVMKLPAKQQRVAVRKFNNIESDELRWVC